MAIIKEHMHGDFTDHSQPEYWGTTANVENGKWNNYGSAFANTDWFEEFYKKNVPSTQHNLSLSGGTEKFNWSVSGSFLLQNGLISHGHDELDPQLLMEITPKAYGDNSPKAMDVNSEQAWEKNIKGRKRLMV